MGAQTTRALGYGNLLSRLDAATVQLQYLGADRLMEKLWLADVVTSDFGQQYLPFLSGSAVLSSFRVVAHRREEGG
ncbi:hypothetical protein Aduo_003964 [Ancylostoma duodenale]